MDSVKPCLQTKKTLKFVKCKCGAAFLLLPDARQMGRIIDAHAKEHGKREKDPTRSKAEIKCIQDILLKQVFEKAAQET